MLDRRLLDSVNQLSPADRLDLISELWHSIDVDDLEVPPAERDLLDDRLHDLRDHPGAGRSWEAIETGFHSRHR